MSGKSAKPAKSAKSAASASTDSKPAARRNYDQRPPRGNNHRTDDANAFMPDPEGGPATIADDLAENLAEEYLQAAHARGFSEVRLIHGRGIGVQRRIVQSLLSNHPLVAAFVDAPEDRGGRGATLVRIRSLIDMGGLDGSPKPP